MPFDPNESFNYGLNDPFDRPSWQYQPGSWGWHGAQMRESIAEDQRRHEDRMKFSRELAASGSGSSYSSASTNASYFGASSSRYKPAPRVTVPQRPPTVEELIARNTAAETQKKLIRGVALSTMWIMALFVFPDQTIVAGFIIGARAAIRKVRADFRTGFRLIDFEKAHRMAQMPTIFRYWYNFTAIALGVLFVVAESRLAWPHGVLAIRLLDFAKYLAGGSGLVVALYIIVRDVSMEKFSWRTLWKIMAGMLVWNAAIFFG